MRLGGSASGVTFSPQTGQIAPPAGVGWDVDQLGSRCGAAIASAPTRKGGPEGGGRDSRDAAAGVTQAVCCGSASAAFQRKGIVGAWHRVHIDVRPLVRVPRAGIPRKMGMMVLAK
jgi:hypothetical protein